MINLFEKPTKETLRLYETLKALGIHQTIMLEDDGYLQKDMTSPYQWFSGMNYHDGLPLFFNKVAVPPYWEIEGNKSKAAVQHMKRIKAHIKYRKDTAPRSVQSVEWLDLEGKKVNIDYYAKNGHRFSELIFDKDERPVLKRFFDGENKEVYAIHLQKNEVILHWKGVTYSFPKYREFIKFYLEQNQSDNQQLIINTLGGALIAANQIKSNAPHYIVWQENVKGKIPGNMEAVLRGNKFRILVPMKKELNEIHSLINPTDHHKVKQFGYLYPYEVDHQYNNDIVILTNSDQLCCIEELIINLREFNFNIVAKTDVSDKLLDLERHSNVNIYAKATHEKINQLFNQSSIYLDINRGIEVDNAIERAFNHQHIIVGINETQHTSLFLNQEYVFDAVKVSNLIQLLQSLRDKDVRDRHLIKQQSAAGAAMKEDLLNTIKK